MIPMRRNNNIKQNNYAGCLASVIVYQCHSLSVHNNAFCMFYSSLISQEIHVTWTFTEKVLHIYSEDG